MSKYSAPNKPLTKGELDQMMESMLFDRERMRRAYLCRHEKEIRTKTIGAMTAECKKDIRDIKDMESVEKFRDCLSKQISQNIADIKKLQFINCADY